MTDTADPVDPIDAYRTPDRTRAASRVGDAPDTDATDGVDTYRTPTKDHQ